MAFRRLLLITVTLVIIEAQDILAATEDLTNILPLHYSIKIEPNTKHDVFHGEYNVSFLMYNNTQTITLHLENITIYKVVLHTGRQSQVSLDSLKNSTNSIFTERIIPMIHYSYRNKTVTLTFKNSLFPGNHTLYMEFSGDINTNYKGLFKVPFPTDKTNTLWILATNTLSTGGREIFPSLGDSTVKTTFTIAIKHNKFEIALSSMPEVYSESVENDMMWTYFDITPPVSTHKIAFVILPKHINSIFPFNDAVVFLNKNNRPQSIFKILPDLSPLAHKIMLFFEKKFGFKLKIPQIKFIEIPGFQPHPIVASGLVLHRLEDILFDQRFPVTSIVQKNNIQRFIARQIAVQWFMGSSIWSYEWFDAVAEFFGVYALDKIYVNTTIMNRFVLSTVHNSLHLDVDNLMEPITGRKYISSNTTHVRVPPFLKVSALLRMLEHVLEEKFWSDTKAYLLNESLLPMNIWYCFLSDTLPQGCSPKWRWIRTSNYPLITVRRTDLDQFIIQLIYSTLNTTEDHNMYNYRFPFYAFHIQNSQYKLVSPSNLLPTPEKKVFKIEHELVPVVNTNQLGYCRVNYKNKNFFTVSLYENLPALTRAQYIDDEYHLLLQKKKTSSIWYNIIQYLHNESNYEAWYPVIAMFEDMSGFLPFSDEAVISFKKSMGFAVNRVLRIAYDREEVDVKDSFQTCLQYEAFKWACLFENLACEIKQILANIQTNTRDSSIEERRIEQQRRLLREWICCNTLRNSTDLEEIILNSKSHKDFNYMYMNYIPCVGFNKLLRNLKGEDRVKPVYRNVHEHVLLFQSLVAKHVNDHTIEILDNFPFIKPRTMKVATALCIVINHVYSVHLLKKIVTFSLNGDRFVIQDNFRTIITDLVVKKTQRRESQIKKHKNNFKKLWNKNIVQNIPDILKDML